MLLSYSLKSATVATVCSWLKRTAFSNGPSYHHGMYHTMDLTHCGVQTARMTGSYFPTLAVQPILGGGWVGKGWRISTLWPSQLGWYGAVRLFGAIVFSPPLPDSGCSCLSCVASFPMHRGSCTVRSSQICVQKVPRVMPLFFLWPVCVACCLDSVTNSTW